MDDRSEAGQTLVEVAAVLAIVGILLGTSIPRFQDVRNRMAVAEAREAVVALFSRARQMAVALGGAEVRVSEVAQSVELHALGPGGPGGPAGPIARVAAETEHGVILEVAGSAREVVVAYDGLGLGRAASRTLRLRRGDAEASIVVASYGRVRREAR